MNPVAKNWKPVELKNAIIDGGFWADHLKANRTATLESVGNFCKSTGRLDAFALAAGGTADPESANVHQFYDSDSAKWLEGLAWCITTHPNADAEKFADEIIDQIAAAQQPDGYLNTFYTVRWQQKRFTNLRDMHELYCAGHLTEAAVAYYKATGKDKFLKTMCRYVDLIAETFGTAGGQIPGYPGHEEIELALIKLYELTGEAKHLELACYFIDQRGQQPLYFGTEHRNDPRYNPNNGYHQSHKPVRQQTKAKGHAVRAMYLYSAMADAARLTNDSELLDACRKLWQSVTDRKMYIIGGIGSCHVGETFTFDYDLPNEQAYAETCAAIGLMMFAHRMLHADAGNGFAAKYADIMELALYNGILSGVSLDGTSFFYDNYLASCPPYHQFHNRKLPQRQQWFKTSCCPTNIVRLLGSLGTYTCSVSSEGIAVHLYAQGRINFKAGGKPAALHITTNYPWDENIIIEAQTSESSEFELQLRIPGFCDNAALLVNNEQCEISGDYAVIKRTWQNGDRVELTLPMPPKQIYAHKSVRHNTGKVAVKRGPVVYCLEQHDNGSDLNALSLPATSELTYHFEPELLGGVTVIEADGLKISDSGTQSELYSTTAPKTETAHLKFIPYCRWANRSAGEMIVWVNQGCQHPPK